MEKLQAYFENIGFSGEVLAQILHLFTLKTFQKNDYFCEEGKTSRYLGFVETGVFQYFSLKDGEERTTYISVENTFLASLLSFVSETPARENIRAISEGSLSVISKTNLKKLVDEIPPFKDFYISLLEHSICGIDATRQDLIVLSGEQRYEKMLQEEPHLLLRIPLQYLASMLGVTPRHLSRIRKNTR